MTYRVTEKMLKESVFRLSHVSGDEYALDGAYGGYRLTNADGSHEYSKRSTKRDLYDAVWLAIEVLYRKENQSWRG